MFLSLHEQDHNMITLLAKPRSKVKCYQIHGITSLY